MLHQNSWRTFRSSRSGSGETLEDHNFSPIIPLRVHLALSTSHAPLILPHPLSSSLLVHLPTPHRSDLRWACEALHIDPEGISSSDGLWAIAQRAAELTPNDVARMRRTKGGAEATREGGLSGFMFGYLGMTRGDMMRAQRLRRMRAARAIAKAMRRFLTGQRAARARREAMQARKDSAAIEIQVRGTIKEAMQARQDGAAIKIQVRGVGVRLWMQICEEPQCGWVSVFRCACIQEIPLEHFPPFRRCLAPLSHLSVHSPSLHCPAHPPSPLHGSRTLFSQTAIRTWVTRRQGILSRVRRQLAAIAIQRRAKRFLWQRVEREQRRQIGADARVESEEFVAFLRYNTERATQWSRLDPTRHRAATLLQVGRGFRRPSGRVRRSEKEAWDGRQAWDAQQETGAQSHRPMQCQRHSEMPRPESDIMESACFRLRSRSGKGTKSAWKSGIGSRQRLASSATSGVGGRGGRGAYCRRRSRRDS